jgi:hypothetical protein
MRKVYLPPEIWTNIFEFDPTFRKYFYSEVVSEIKKYVGVYKLMTHNRSAIRESGRVHCLSCFSSFHHLFIDEYTDNSDTGICPYCFVDALVPHKHLKYLKGHGLHISRMFRGFTYS